MVVPLGRPVVGDRVGVAAVGEQLGQQLVERPGVAELVLGERAHRDVLLEERGDPRPLGIGESDDELVVGHGEENEGQRVPGGGEQRLPAADRRRHGRAPGSPLVGSFVVGSPAAGASARPARTAASLSRMT